ncbi:protein HEXIM1-like [Rana temporaria]|uniref:protein HEXIM1-like n=1 Tax=Rana temporaria TaxID=8407 RepID=UPI001AACF600|nr:protein HEXIM1-like [Rana temporaria]
MGNGKTARGLRDSRVGDSHEPEGPWRELGRKRHRRLPSKKKRSWKPYNKLTWEEKKRLEERESQRASKMQAEMFAKGQPVAPYNTTKFLQKDFSETYEKYHVESLQDMSKQELIREYMELEKCMSRMEEENNHLRSQQADPPKLHELEMELEKLKEENRRLRREQVVADPLGH